MRLMRWMSALRLLLFCAAVGLVAAFLLSGRAPELAPGDLAVALAAGRGTPDAEATRAVATFAAALVAPPPFAGAASGTPAPSSTPLPTGTPVPPATASPSATPTPKHAATAMALRREVNTAVAATLTAQPTAPPPAAPPPAAQPAAPPEGGNLQMIGIVDGGGLVNVRAGPGLDYPVLMGLDSGEKVIILGRSTAADWLQIRAANGTLGWMAAVYVRTGQAPGSFGVVAP